MKTFSSNSQKIGKLGEDVACKFLMKHKFSILERNFTRKWGEIDIVAKKDSVLHFIEVKSKCVNSLSDIVTHETEILGRPEDNMHLWKIKRLSRTIETYLIHNRIGNTAWQFDLYVVYMDLANRKARVETLNDLVL